MLHAQVLTGEFQMRINDILDISDNLLKLILKLILKDSLQPASVKMFENHVFTNSDFKNHSGCFCKVF